MKNFSLFLSLFLLTFALHTSTIAQSSTDKATAKFHLERKNDSLLILHADITPSKGLSIFTTHKQNADDAFVSTFTLDSSLLQYTRATDTIAEKGALQTIHDASTDATLQEYAAPFSLEIPIHIAAEANKTIKGTFTWLGKSGDEFPTGDIHFAEQEKAANATVANTSTTNVDTPKTPWKIFWGSLLIGLAMVFTPCVFPLIPVTVSFFLKKSKSRADGIKNALTYSISIILIYTLPTLIITMIFGQTAMYKIATSVAANLLFFAIFVIFAISFFGAFELALPNKWANTADEKSSKGGLIGIFFMALTLVIVSFSCTGPFVGSLLAQVSGTSALMAPVFGMLGLSAGLAIPFSLFAFFPSLLQSLPKSGGWLNSVKVVFGFVELALAMKFLSNVDLIYGWHLLDREIFLAIWVVLSFMTGMYLLGKIKFSHDSDLKFVSIPRLFFAIAAFCFGTYLTPGLWGAPLKGMSGMLPPPNTQDFNLNDLQYKIGNATTGTKSASNALPPKLYTDKLHDAPFGLTTYYDFNEGMAAAKALNKPVMLDFTGHSCQNCRKMENEVWSNPDVLQRLRNDFVIISLYVDEQSDLPADQVYTNAKGEKITTLAQKSLDYEISKFGFNAQPLYMFIDLNEKPLSDVKYGYDPDIQKFIQHLDTVKAAFAKK